MVEYNGEGNTGTNDLGWDSVNNIKGNIRKNNINNYFLHLSWNGVEVIVDTTIKYVINYLDNQYITGDNKFILPVNYANTIIDENTGIKIAQEVCLTIETRYYLSNETFASGETQTFCFCPPVDPFCYKIKKTEKKPEKISKKMRYTKAVGNKNGAMGLTFSGCSSVSQWNQLSLNLQLAKNNCYNKDKVLILPKP